MCHSLWFFFFNWFTYLFAGKGPTNSCGRPDYLASTVSSQRIFELQSSSTMVLVCLTFDAKTFSSCFFLNIYYCAIMYLLSAGCWIQYARQGYCIRRQSYTSYATTSIQWNISGSLWSRIHIGYSWKIWVCIIISKSQTNIVSTIVYL
jgi:hypothetical protein